MIDDSITQGTLTKEQVAGLEDLNERLIGYISIYDEAPPPVPSHGIRRPTWFKPGGVTVSDVNRIGLQLRGRK